MHEEKLVVENLILILKEFMIRYDGLDNWLNLITKINIFTYYFDAYIGILMNIYDIFW